MSRGWAVKAVEGEYYLGLVRRGGNIEGRSWIREGKRRLKGAIGK